MPILVMINASFEITSCQKGDEMSSVPSVKLVPITIKGGKFSHCYTGHDTDKTNASFDIMGETQATLALPVVDGSIWDARVFYNPNSSDFISFRISPSASHSEDKHKISFHTLRRDRCDVVFNYEIVQLLAPTDVKVQSGNTISIEWNKVYDAFNYEVEVIDKEDVSVLNTTLDTSILVSVAPGDYYVRVRALSLTGPKGLWSDYIYVVVIAPPVDSDLKKYLLSVAEFYTKEAENIK